MRSRPRIPVWRKGQKLELMESARMKEATAKEHSLIFTAESVRAILEGRKSQTRRVVPLLLPGDKKYINAASRDEWIAALVKQCHYGVPGDRLWVRETFSINSVDAGTASVGYKERLPQGKTIADTDGGLNVFHIDREEWKWAEAHVDSEKWRSPLFMPRWASRLTLEIIRVRVQRVQEIGLEDVQCEGVIFTPQSSLKQVRMQFAHLWDSLNAKRGYPWESNPWVWVITFKRVSQ